LSASFETRVPIVISNKFATFAFTCKPCPRRGYSDYQCLKVLHFLVKRLYVRGESMEPTLRSGELILVDTKATQPREGIHVLRLDDALLVKRLHILPGRRLKVVSDNPIWQVNILECFYFYLWDRARV
jgi:hypothetical protein